MQTILDDSRWWALEAIAFNRDLLKLVLVECIMSAEPEDLLIGDVNLGPADRSESTEKSRRVSVTFPAPVAHQVVDESVSTPHDDEVHDGGILRCYSRSRWIEYLQLNAFLEHWRAEGAVHYQVVTQDEIVDVLCRTAPTVEAWVPKGV